MTEATNFLLEFRKTRDFKITVPTLLANTELRSAVFALLETSEYPFPEYTSWIAIHFYDQHPNLMGQKELNTILEILLKTKNHTVQRNLCNVLEKAPFLLAEHGELLDRLFYFLSDKTALPALKYHAIRVIERHYLPMYPELVREVKSILTILAEEPKPWMRSVVKKFDTKYQKHPFYVD